MTETSPKRRTKRRTWLFGCLGVGCGIPILSAVLLLILFSRNNRPPQIFIPTPAMPVPNAYDDFVRAGQLVRAMKHKSPYTMTGTRAQNETLANFAACAKDAEPGLAVLRQGLHKTYLQPPDRSFKSVTFPTLATFRELARTVSGAAGY